MLLADLSKDQLYILSSSGVPNGAIFSKIITFVTAYKIKFIKNYNNPIVTHIALLANHNNKWHIHEIDLGGKITKLFFLQENKKYYISPIGDISDNEKTLILDEYSDSQDKNIIKLIIRYPFLKAAASYELPKINFLNKIINKVINYIRDIYESTLKLFGVKERLYCVEAALHTIRDINYHRISLANNQNYILLNIGSNLLKKIKDQNYRLDEIYPQDIIDNMQYFELQN